MKEVSTKTNDVAGDGTTTATLLAQAIVREGLKNLAAGANPMVMKKGIAKATALQLEQKGMKAVVDLPERLVIHGNQSLLYSIFRNLTDNAIAYAGEGTTIQLSAHDEGSQWRFVFSDNGVGIEPQHLSRIFERFYRVDKGRSRKMGGTGLGLAIVKNAVGLHGGSITATCPAEGGMRFEFTLNK